MVLRQQYQMVAPDEEKDSLQKQQDRGEREAARANTMTGGLELSFGFPGNGKIPYPPSGHLESANQHAPSKKKGTYQRKAKKPANAQV